MKNIAAIVKSIFVTPTATASSMAALVLAPAFSKIIGA